VIRIERRDFPLRVIEEMLCLNAIRIAESEKNPAVRLVLQR
jgi:hypothetical protein